MPKISVIIPTCNRLNLLRETLASVIGQQNAPYEIIVVNDGSVDGTQDYLESLGDSVRVFRLEGEGPGAARNLGAENASGEYLAFLDDDDLWYPETLTIYSKILEQCHLPSFLAGKPQVFHESSALLEPSTLDLLWTQFPDYYASSDAWRWWGASSFVIRRDSFNAVGGFCAQRVNGEDADLAMRLGQAEGFVQIMNPVTFAYREHSDTAKQNLAHSLAGMRYIIATEQGGHYPGGQVRSRQRWRIMARHVRPVSLECLRDGLNSEAWELFRETVAWNFALGRWKYLLGFVFMATAKRIIG